MNDDPSALVGLAFDGDGAAVFADDASDDEQAESGARGFGGAVGLEECAHVLGRNASSVVFNGNDVLKVVHAGADRDEALIGWDRLEGIADQVVEHLLKLAGVDEGGREGACEVEFDGDLARFEFRFKQAQGVVEDGV